MDFAEKIIMLRKQKGWSQEELATQLDISRQSVSKWESRMSVPDLDKVIKLSEIFGVTTDYLLKDGEVSQPMLKEETPNTSAYENTYTELNCEKQSACEEEEDSVRYVTMKEAQGYLDTISGTAKKIAGAVFLFIISPITLILLSGMAEYGVVPLSENSASGLGLIVLLLFVAVGVMILIFNGTKFSGFEYLEKEDVVLESGVREMAQRCKEEFDGQYRKIMTIGIGLCILSVIPLFTALALDLSDLYYIYGVCFILLLCALGVFLIVWMGSIHGSFQKLLEEGDYTRKKKRIARKYQGVAGAYWCTITAVYLGISFLTRRWEISWVIWPCAGVIWAAIYAILSASKK